MKSIAVSVCEPLPSEWQNSLDSLISNGYSLEWFSTAAERLQMETRIRNREFHAVLDCAASDLIGQPSSNRLTAAGLMGIPQIICVGGIDFHFGENRPTTAEECDTVGKVIVERACAATGPTKVMVPLKGFSKRTQNPTANAALLQSMRNWVYPPELLMEVDLHYSDETFGNVVVERLMSGMGKV